MNTLGNFFPRALDKHDDADSGIALASAELDASGSAPIKPYVPLLQVSTDYSPESIGLLSPSPSPGQVHRLTRVVVLVMKKYSGSESWQFLRDKRWILSLRARFYGKQERTNELGKLGFWC